MATTRKNEDRRVQRTRQLLQQAFKEIVREKGRAGTGIRGIEKGFVEMNIGDITERANINRGTFYLHFTDKYRLAEAVMREEFRRMVGDALPSSPGWNRQSLQLLIEALLDSFEQKYNHQQHSSAVLAPLLDKTTKEELTRLLLAWLQQEENHRAEDSVRLETIATIVSWAIFGTALEWSQKAVTLSKEEMTASILQVISGGNGSSYSR